MNRIETKEISFYLKNGESNLSSNYFIYHSSKTLQTPKKSAKKILPQIGSQQQLWQKKKELSKEEFLKNYLIKKRKKTMIISKYLDDDFKQRLEKVKNTFNILDNFKSKPESEILNDHNEYLEPSLVFVNESMNSSSTNSIISSNFNNNFRRRINEYKNKGLIFKSACENIDEHLKSKSIRFGSTLSKDGQYALLKSLEDQILQEIQYIYPDYNFNNIPRLSTASYKQIISTEFNQKLSEEEIMEYKQNITRCIELALEILDDLHMKKMIIQRSKTDFEDSFKIDNDITVEDLDSEYLQIRHSRMKDATYGSLSSKTTSTIDPVTRYSEWCNQWIIQLDSI